MYILRLFYIASSIRIFILIDPIFNKVYSFDTSCKQTQSSAPQNCSSHFLTHVSRGTGMLHAAATSYLFAENHMMNGTLAEWVIGRMGIEWLRVLVNESLGEWGHWMKNSPVMGWGALSKQSNIKMSKERPINQLTHKTIHPPIGGGVYTYFKSSNRIEISWFI